MLNLRDNLLGYNQTTGCRTSPMIKSQNCQFAADRLPKHLVC